MASATLILYPLTLLVIAVIVTEVTVFVVAGISGIETDGADIEIEVTATGFPVMIEKLTLQSAE